MGSSGWEALSGPILGELEGTIGMEANYKKGYAKPSVLLLRGNILEKGFETKFYFFLFCF